jgi:hypothetical protein
MRTGGRNDVNAHLVSLSCMAWQVLEIRPSIKWDKGKALEFLLKSLGQ